jgi:hypothetical protein
MRKFALTVIALLLCGSVSSLFAQKRVEAGIFLDYLSISQTNTNNFGVGGRLGYRIHRNVMMEGEVAYDYGINFDEAYRNIHVFSSHTSNRKSGLHLRPSEIT